MKRDIDPDRILRPVPSVDAFVAAPAGHYLSGPTFVRFCPGPELTGLVEWGCPDRDSAGSIVRSLEADRALAPHGFFHDAQRLSQQQDPSAFSIAFDELKRRIARAPLPVARIAAVLAPGLAGGVVAGFYGMLPRKLPVRFFETPIAALAWLGVSAARPLAEELEHLTQAAQGDPLLLRLQQLLESQPQLELEVVARTLGVSVRSLQRHLAGAKTTFRDEVNTARVRCAQRLLESSDLKITAVALEVGCATSQHFSALFRRLTGEPPSRWRARRRSRLAAVAPAGTILAAR